MVIDARLRLVPDAHRARHAEVHQQHVAGGKIGEQVFGAAAEALDGLAGEPLLEVLGDRPAQAAVAHLDLFEARALHGGGEPQADGFDLGKFGHG